MADEGMQLRVSANARLEKYAVGTTSEDIKSGKAKPVEVIVSEDVMVDPDESKLKILQDMGYDVPEEAWSKARKVREAKDIEST